MSPRAKKVAYVLAGLMVVTGLFGAFVVVAALRGLDTHRDLADFASPAEARAFTSAHVPTPLPADAVIESLSYDRFTDWILEAQVRFTSPAETDRFLDESRRTRKLNDAYCPGEEPANGARYFLSGVSACGSLLRTSASVIEVHCNTR